ncbi:MAG: excinuclease ABC subunit UvrA [Gemmatimonadota bacterium]
MKAVIRVRGARQNNLKGIDLSIPRRALTVLTGPSGSGKSSLAFDTIYAEGQRRYIESLSTYAKQFLERMRKPAVEWIDGVSPSVAIDQRNTIHSSRSTVGTVTEAYDYMRVLWARVGHTICPECGVRVLPDTVQSAADRLLELERGTRLYVTFPLRLSAEITHAVTVANLRSQGYLRVLADGREWHLDDLEKAAGASVPTEDPQARVTALSAGRATGGGRGAAAGGRRRRESRARPAPDLTRAKELLVVSDRLAVDADDRERLTDSLAAAFAEGEGHAVVVRAELDENGEARITERFSFTESFRCSGCGRDFPEPRPVLFSFNHPTGACPRCNGFGATLEYDVDLIVPDQGRSLADGALDPLEKPRYHRERAALRRFAVARGIDVEAPWRELPEAVREELLHGSDDFLGVLPFLRSRERKRYKRYIRVFLRQYQRPRTCPRCGGARLRREALDVRVGGLTISEATALTVDAFGPWLASLELAPFEEKVAATVLRELRDRISFLERVGLGYLTLDRVARTLSGGEMQRIRLASSLGSHLVDTLYVLDEPTIGLHARDVDRFLNVLEELRDRGNTVLVVEHETAVLRRADRIVELGPGSGEKGGEVVFEGRWEELVRSDTATGRALASVGAAAPPGPARRRRGSGDNRRRAGGGASVPRGLTGAWQGGAVLRLRGARLHNLRGVDVEIPLRTLTAVTGVSGSGKSTLVHDVLYRGLERALRGETTAKEHLGEQTGRYDAIDGLGALDDVVLVDQSPIGRTPRSNPVTYIKAFDEIRRLFAEQPLARRRRYEPRHFSFNVEGGRCEECKGAGIELIEMVFMADISVPCDACGGKRFRPEILEVRYRGLNIDEVLQLTVDEAIRFFIRRDRLGEALWQLQRVGLGYLRLGQPATTLSGGEAQRLKIARELSRMVGAGRRLYMLDEPTVGLGLGEIGRLVDVLRQLVTAGNTVVVIEHNLEVIRRADWVIDLGPEAAERGGRVVAVGTPADIMAATGSHTGAYLRRYLEGHETSAAAGAAPAG